MQAAIVVDSRNARHQHVVVLAGHQMATHNIVAVPHGRLKGAQHRGRLPLQRNADVHRHLLAEHPVVDQRAIAADRPRLLERQDAPRSRRCGKADRLTHLIICCPALPCQVAQDGVVQFVEVHTSVVASPWIHRVRRLLTFRRLLRELVIFITFRSHSAVLSRNLHTFELIYAVKFLRVGKPSGSSPPYIDCPDWFQLQAALPGVETK